MIRSQSIHVGEGNKCSMVIEGPATVMIIQEEAAAETTTPCFPEYEKYSKGIQEPKDAL